jgi:hypothetical protein
MPNSAARGSIAFIPYLACVVIVPSWTSVAAISIVKGAVELGRRIEARKALFNVVQHALTASCAILIYRALGGVSLLSISTASLIDVTRAVGFPAMSAFSLSLFANASLVCFGIALTSQKNSIRIWRETVLPSIGIDLIAGPMIFVFAWVYAAYGPIAAAALWVPILGLREVHRVNIQLQKTNEELLQLMVKSIEARDPYTSGHSRRVQHYSVIIGRALGLRDKELDFIGKAALLHDVGKIYEKYAPILRKPDKLSPEEWTTVQEHPADGANLVATMTGLRDVVPAIRHHHENWDGSGYPDGLVGNAIPFAARIITFADTIDAMTTDRPYRSPLSESQVHAEIIRCRGRQFDPEIADRLLASPMWHMLFNPAARPTTPRQGLTLVSDARARETA